MAHLGSGCFSPSRCPCSSATSRWAMRCARPRGSASGERPADASTSCIGNHDVTGEGEVRAQGFDGVWSVMTSAGDPPLLWTHHPLREVPEGHVNIHGHEHGSPPGMSPHINVSIEQLEYLTVHTRR